MNIPLLCIAGTLCDGRIFAPMLAAAGAAADANCTMVEHASVEASAIATLAMAPPRFVAMGFSLGGFVALELARRAPHRVLGIVLLASNARPDPTGNAVSRRAQLAMFEARGAAAMIEETWSSGVAPANADRKEVHALLVAMAADTPPARFTAQTELAISRPDSRPCLADLTMPLLAIHGREDRICPPDRSTEISRAVRAASQTLIADAGHFVLLEEPDMVADAVVAWLAQEGLR